VGRRFVIGGGVARARAAAEQVNYDMDDW